MLHKECTIHTVHSLCGLCLQFYFCQTTHLAEISGEIQYKVLQHLAKKVRKLITDCTIYSCTVPAHVYGNLYSHTSTHTYTLRVNFITHAYFFQNIHKAFIMHSQVLVRTLRVVTNETSIFKLDLSAAMRIYAKKGLAET